VVIKKTYSGKRQDVWAIVEISLPIDLREKWDTVERKRCLCGAVWCGVVRCGSGRPASEPRLSEISISVEVVPAFFILDPTAFDLQFTSLSNSNCQRYFRTSQGSVGNTRRKQL